MTRLADVTGLDAIGVPVFQAIRPFGRGLSVHQGKGETPAEAALGALMEAIEVHMAEACGASLIHRAFLDLASDERAARIGDFACDRGEAPSVEEPLDWVQARTFPEGRPFWLPFDVVSLDFSRAGDLRLDRSSDGLACRFVMEEAVCVGLLEAIERDAVACFRAGPAWARATRRIVPPYAAMPWLEGLRARLDALDIVMRLYEAPAVVPLPTMVCELCEPAACGLPRADVFGSACHPDPETALRKAVFEAAQSRLTAISGARDDILPHDYTDPGAQSALVLSPPPGFKTTLWEEVEARCSRRADSAEAIAALLREAGYETVAVADLTPDEPEVAVIKAVVPGLGSERRRRRPPTSS